MSYATIDDLRSQLGGPATPTWRSPAYIEKMMHPIPVTTEVDRVGFALDLIRGKRVLEFGASGPMHELVMQEAASCIGVDRVDGDGVIGFDLDDVSQAGLPHAEADVIYCGEILEHLGNPQWFLTRLRRQYPGVPVIITVPNAFTAVGRAHLVRSVENVNKDHVAWYSYRTLLTLLERVGYGLTAFHWYGGGTPTAQGLIALVE